MIGVRQFLDYLSRNPYGELLATSWRYAAGWRGRYVGIYLMFVAVNVLVSLQPIIFGRFVEYLQRGEGNLVRGALIYGGVYLSIIFASWAFQWPARLMERRLAFDISERLLLETYDRVVELPLNWHRTYHSGETINRARKGYEALKNFFDSGFLYFQTLARMLLALTAIIFFSPLYGAVAGAVGCALVVVVLTFDKPIILNTQRTNERENDLLASLTDNLSNIITVTTLRLGTRTAKRIGRRVRNIWPPFLAVTKLNEQKWFFTSVLIGLMYSVIVVGYVYQHYAPGKVFLVGGLVTLIGYVTQFSNMFSGLTGQYNQIIRYRADLSAIEPIAEAHAGQAIVRVDPAAVVRDWRTLSVDRLDFSYDTDSERAGGLRNVSLRLDRGWRIALIGPSGSGKTTTLYALRGLYPPDRLDISLDGRRLEKPAVLYQQTTLIPQSPEIFEDTIRNNLTMGLARTPEEVDRAIYLAALEDVITAADQGLDTHLSEGGANLSGGQRQRLSIARGLLAADTSTLLLLDEPTSSLDPQTELNLYARLFEGLPEKTIVSTLHRLHLLRQFDYVYYLEEGRVVEEGTLEDLLAEGGMVAGMWGEQMG